MVCSNVLSEEGAYSPLGRSPRRITGGRFSHRQNVDRHITVSSNPSWIVVRFPTHKGPRRAPVLRGSIKAGWHTPDALSA